MLNIIGLGKKDKDISLRGYELIKSSKKIILKTDKVEACKFLKEENIIYESLDYLFESCIDFDSLHDKIVEKLLSYDQDICYLVPYSPLSDSSVISLMSKAQVNIIDCVGHIEVASENAVILSAYHLPDIDTFCFDKSCQIQIYDIDNINIASEVKLFLCEIVGDECECDFCGNLIKVYEIDRQKKYSYMTTVVICPQKLESRQAFSYYDLIEILKRLRGVDGCKWDKAQTHESLKKNLLEEANELIEAIDEKDPFHVQEECGDVLLQPVFHAAIANDENEFSYRDMINTLCKKLIFRHSHVFGDDKVNSEEEALVLWKRNKIKEKEGRKA